jgi:hypothetical protein
MFRMPAGYQLTAATSAARRPFAIYRQLRGGNGADRQKPAGTQAMRAAASSPPVALCSRRLACSAANVLTFC